MPNVVRCDACEKFYDDITQIYKTGKLKDKSKPYKNVI